MGLNSAIALTSLYKLPGGFCTVFLPVAAAFTVLPVAEVAGVKIVAVKTGIFLLAAVIGVCGNAAPAKLPGHILQTTADVGIKLTKLLGGVGASRILADYPEIIAHVLSHLEENGVKRAAEFIRVDEGLVKSGYPKNPGLRYALLFASLDEKQAADAMNSLKPSRDEKNAVMTLVKKRGGGFALNKYAVKCLMRDAGDDFADTLARYLFVTGAMTAEAFETAQSLSVEILAEDACRRVAQLEVNGQDMMALGLKGRQIGDTLAGLLDLVMRGEVGNSRSALLEAAQSLRGE